MAKIVLNDAGIFLGERDLRGDMNALGLEYKTELKDATTFANNGWNARIDGLKSVDYRLEGLFDEVVDDFLHQKFSVDVPVTLTPSEPVVGARCFVLHGVTSSYSPSGAIGDAFSFSIQGSASADGVGQGAIEYNGTTATSGASLGQLLDISNEGDRLLVSIHVLDVSAGGSLDIAVESDLASDFATPTTQATSATYTTSGSEILVINGPINDTWWRISYTVSGSVTFVVGMGK